MLANVDYVNWKPDMLWFDNHRIYGSPDYYVQKLFMIIREAEGWRYIRKDWKHPELRKNLYVGESGCRGIIQRSFSGTLCWRTVKQEKR